MKISKLFHWLYGLVMLLPIFAILSTILVNTFNKEVTQPTQEAEITYKYETNEVNTLDDVVLGNIYHLDYFDSDSLLKTIDYQFDFYMYKCDSFGYDIDGIFLNEWLSNENNDNYIKFSCNVVSGNFYCWEVELQTNDTNLTLDDAFDYLTIENFIISFGDNTSLQNFNNYFLLANQYQMFSISEWNIIESVEIITQDTSVNDIFYYAVDKVENSPLFSWAYDSFLTAPFAYIVNLFGMPTNHVIVELLSYWLAISIIWLVFDLVMYVPLLVHRWLDKGVLE